MLSSWNLSSKFIGLYKSRVFFFRFFCFFLVFFIIKEKLKQFSRFKKIFFSSFRDDNLKHTDLTTKLEPAFLAGLRFPVPTVRSKFFDVFDQSMPKFLHERLLYIVCSQNWEHMGPHYWIKQCLELLTTTAIPSKFQIYYNPVKKNYCVFAFVKIPVCFQTFAFNWQIKTTCCQVLPELQQLSRLVLPGT